MGFIAAVARVMQASYAARMERRATCSCGQLVVVCQGEPTRVSMCHCLACQQRTGSTFGVQARYSCVQVEVQGATSVYARRGDSGGEATFHFCPTCGATVCWYLDGLPEDVAVAVGAFADTSFPPPTVSVYSTRQHAWGRMPDLEAEEWG